MEEPEVTDGDMYGSVMDVPGNIYDRLSEGKFYILNDYALENCKQLVDDFRKQHGRDEEMITTDWTGVYWRKA